VTGLFRQAQCCIADFDPVGHHLTIAIEDQGPGVANADLAAIFQPFFRGSRQVGHGL